MIYKPKLNENLMLLQANELVRAKQDDLTILEARLIRLAIAQVVKSDTDFRTYKCSLSELAGFLQLSKQTVYEEIANISDSLLKKIIAIQNPNSKDANKPDYIKFHWVDTIIYQDGYLVLKLSHELKPYLLGLEQLFTMYGYETLLHLPTNYSIRLYELLISWQNKPFSDLDFYSDKFQLEQDEVVFSLDYLRKYFNCENKYPSAGDFIRRVIDSSVSYINKNSIMKISYRKIKNGTKIEYIIFKYLRGATDKELQDRFRDARLLVEQLSKEREEQLSLFDSIY